MFLVESKLMDEVLIAETEEDALLNSRIKNRLVLNIERLNSRDLLCFHHSEGEVEKIAVRDYLRQVNEPCSVGVILRGKNSPLTVQRM